MCMYASARDTISARTAETREHFPGTLEDQTLLLPLRGERPSPRFSVASPASRTPRLGRKREGGRESYLTFLHEYKVQYDVRPPRGEISGLALCARRYATISATREEIRESGGEAAASLSSTAPCIDERINEKPLPSLSLSLSSISFPFARDDQEILRSRYDAFGYYVDARRAMRPPGP